MQPIRRMYENILKLNYLNKLPVTQSTKTGQI